MDCFLYSNTLFAEQAYINIKKIYCLLFHKRGNERFISSMAFAVLQKLESVPAVLTAMLLGFIFIFTAKLKHAMF